MSELPTDAANQNRQSVEDVPLVAGVALEVASLAMAMTYGVTTKPRPLRYLLGEFGRSARYIGRAVTISLAEEVLPPYHHDPPFVEPRPAESGLADRLRDYTMEDMPWQESNGNGHRELTSSF